MATWIFQGNPKFFDIDGYLAESTGIISWLVNAYADRIRAGDSVYIWKSQGVDKASSGIVAQGTILESPTPQTDEALSRRYWRIPRSDEPYPQVKIRLNRVASSKEILKRDWMKDDSELRDLLILRRPAGTNFPMTRAQESRLGQLWRKTGSDWSRDEVIAALYLYELLQGSPISKVAGSQVEQLGQQLGRAPTGVYNRLMNFRALDPRTELQGMDATSATDRLVWAQFFNDKINKIEMDALRAENGRLWGNDVRSDKDANATLQSEEERLAKRPASELLELYKKRPKNPKPRRSSQTTVTYDRDPLVVALRKKLSGYKCEVEGCSSPQFVTTHGVKFVEVHHLVRLADGGPDVLENTATLCPTHHRFLHHGAEKGLLAAHLIQKRESDAES